MDKDFEKLMAEIDNEDTEDELDLDPAAAADTPEAAPEAASEAAPKRRGRKPKTEVSADPDRLPSLTPKPPADDTDDAAEDDVPLSAQTLAEMEAGRAALKRQRLSTSAE